MNTSNRNTLWASIVAEELYRAGIRTVCASPGSRSAPLMVALAALSQAEQDFDVLMHIDERSGSFFGLGLAKVLQAPVALLCTSGTAAANYYPAIIEAFYSRVPLVILTADRPPELRDCGAGQTIDQIKLYGDHVRYFFEVGVPTAAGFQLRHLRSLVSRAVGIAAGKAEMPAGPVHLNFAFTEPLAPIAVPEDVEDLSISAPLAWAGKGKEAYTQSIIGRRILSTEAIATIANQIISCPRGVIVVGVYDAPEGFESVVKHLARATGYPLLAEATGIDRNRAISCYDSFLRATTFANTHAPQLVIRFGDMPTSKNYRLWLEKHLESDLSSTSDNHPESVYACQQIIIGDGRNSDPTHGLVQSIHANPISFCEQLADYLEIYALSSWQDSEQNKQWRLDFEQAESIAIAAIANFLKSVDTLFEGKVFAELGRWLPAHTQIYVASSTPIRDLDTFFHSAQHLPVLANRGANGIDGTLSSALGAAWGSKHSLILICGDLAFYHDLNGLMAVKQYNINLTVILLNNDGGGIFEMLPIADFEPPFEEYFATPHGLDFAPIVTAYGGEHVLIQDWQHFQQAVLNSLHQTGTQVLEIRSDRKQTKQLRQQLWQSVTTAINQQIN